MFYINDLQANYEKYNLPEEFVMCLPVYCSECGAPLAMSETLTGLHCSNPRCNSKMIMRIKAICKDLNILNFGESRIEKFVDYYEPTNPLDIFALQEGMVLGEGISLEVSNSIIKQIHEKDTFLLWEFVQVANIPFVRTSARKIFQGYKNIEDAYADIENGGVGFITEKLGIKTLESEVSIQAMKVYESLMAFKDDLLEGEGYVHIKDITGIREINAVCSDQVGGGFSKKPEFYSYVKNRYGDRIQINFLSSVNKNIDYLIWAGADGTPARYTSKVQKVERYNQSGSANISIVNANMFIREMDRLVG